MKEQYKIRLEEETIGYLAALARRYGRRTGNEIAGEVISQYLGLWEEAEQGKQAIIERQYAAVDTPQRKRA